MREIVFVQRNEEKWKRFENNVEGSPDETAEQFIELTDDLSYARTFYPNSATTKYLNKLTAKFHLSIYKNKKEKTNRIVSFWKYELPQLLANHRKQLLYSFLIFFIGLSIGALSAAKDETFVRLILGDSYVNQTIQNIEKGEPTAIYKSGNETDMFMAITVNNIKVSFLAFIAGVLLSLGTAWLLFTNGIMLGAFQYFFYTKGVLMASALSIWIHGTLEISAIIIAGCAGLVMGNSILFPHTYSRLDSFKKGARNGIKIVIGLVPIFITAGFLESFITRYAEMPLALSLFIILGSLSFVLYYFVIYPYRLTNHQNQLNATQN
ncbi:stage II sporulation protein M [Solitalea sp. MAHUQ-68]|uniref:Stage II sporulation protein M n=1 Tax=Solitalea agri TaxID=2953739 RepID=A0A9X2F5T3_9SPHI|nr:stage II sporulation protein M [Solitalea agri]MCO4292891.1 stage II sporulation protein M [Solitalea agri]